MRRSTLFTIHSISGLIVGLFILLMSVSGALLVFHDELDRLQWPAAEIMPSKKNAGIDSCYAALRTGISGTRISHCMLPEKITEPFLFTVYDSSYKGGNLPRQAFLHPQTTATLGVRGGSKDISGNFMSWLSAFHNSFHAGKTGEWLLGFFAVLFFLSLVTGFFLYRKSIVAVLLFRRRVFRRDKLHQLIGVYALLFNLMIAVSGFWMQRYVFKSSFYKSFPEMKTEWRSSPALSFSIDSALIQIKHHYPSFTPAVIYFAQSSGGKTAVYGSRSSNSFIHSKKYADRIMLDSTGAIATTAFVTDIPAADRYDIINAQVHYGRYGGWPVRMLYTLFGLSGAGLSITGFILWVRRRQEKKEEKEVSLRV